MHARARALPACHTQRESGGGTRQGRIKHRKTDRILVVERKKILLKTEGEAESRVCQNRTYDELPKRKMVKVKVTGSSQQT